MMSKWMCSALYGGGLAWAVYRLKDAEKRDDGHNREYKTGYVLSKHEAQAMVARLNAAEVMPDGTGRADGLDH